MQQLKSKTGSRALKGTISATGASVLRADLIISTVREQQEGGFSVREGNQGAEGGHDPRSLPSLMQTARHSLQGRAAGSNRSHQQPSGQQASGRRWTGPSSVQEGQAASQEQPGTVLTSSCPVTWFSFSGVPGKGTEVVEVPGDVARKNRAQWCTQGPDEGMD